MTLILVHCKNPGKTCLISSIYLPHFAYLLQTFSVISYQIISAYHPGRSTVTALLRVVYDLFHSVDKVNMSMLTLFDFSSAFDIVDHSMHIYHLHTDFVFTDSVRQ